ncbi:MAG: hypothetical protein KDJ52_10840 [Anaerolineae bacterium]|nr:hypothetical protein [Anaerolineae bacterium]
MYHGHLYKSILFFLLVFVLVASGFSWPEEDTQPQPSQNVEDDTALSIAGYGAYSQPPCPSTRPLCDFTGTVSRTTRGKVDLSWRYTESVSQGVFLIERSTDGQTWNLVITCKQSPTTATSYFCSDLGLRSGTTYYYRACTEKSLIGTRCSPFNVTWPINVTMP